MPFQTASKNQIKHWRKLHQKKHREKSGLFIAEGERCVEQILENGIIDVKCLIVDENYASLGLTQQDMIRFRDPVDVYSLSKQDFASVSDTENPQGLLAVCRVPEAIPLAKFVDLSGMIIATDAVQDPGNLGTIIRTAAWFGVEGFLCGTGTVDPWHPKVVRSTAGATGAIPVWSGDLETLFEPLEKKGWRVLLLDGGAESIPLGKIRKRDKTVLVIGNEANGIQPDLLKSNRQKTKIEGIAGRVESLNAAIALGIALYALTTES